MIDSTRVPGCSALLGLGVADAMRRAREFLQARDTQQLLSVLGQRFDDLALTEPPAGKCSFPASFGGGQVIARDAETGVLTAGSEPRKDGAAVGW